jgi:uncharacterized protein YbjQ (UPF0145 family)
MIITTTLNIEGKTISNYKGLVTGETILGAKYIMASITDVLGGRSSAYESSLREARDIAMKEMQDQAQEMGANAIVGVDIDYETVGGSDKSMLMVSCSGTAVVVS